MSVEMESTLRRIAELAERVYAKEDFWGVSAMTLMPPASPAEIEALSGEGPRPLPPSYREFLARHDGCLNFWPTFALLGTKGEPREIVAAEVEDAREFQREYAAGEDGRVTPESIARFEVPTEVTQEYYLPSHLVFGTNQGGEFLMFHEGKGAPGGEPEVIHYTYSEGVHARFADFPAFLAATVKRLEDRIEAKGYRGLPS